MMSTSSLQSGPATSMPRIHVAPLPPPKQEPEPKPVDNEPAETIQGSVRVLYKARDTIYCPCCRQNNNVVIDSEKHFATIVRSWAFDYYKCQKCDNAFRQAGMPIVLPGALLFGVSILIAGNFIRSLFT